MQTRVPQANRPFKAVLIPILALALSACGHRHRYLFYRDQDSRFSPPVTEEPEVRIMVDKGRATFFRVIRFRQDWDISHGGAGLSPMSGTTIKKGYHLYDGEGFYGYDFRRTYDDMDEAVEAAEKAGNLYSWMLGSTYRLDGVDLYRTRDGQQLERE